MKLIIQIPCSTRRRHCRRRCRSPDVGAGIDVIETVVTSMRFERRDSAAGARAWKPHRPVRHRKGLAAAFMAGIDASLQAGADHREYRRRQPRRARDRAARRAPLLAGEADIVIGDRNIRDLKHVMAQENAATLRQRRCVRSRTRRCGPRRAGFAPTRDAALRMTVVSSSRTTLESIQAGQEKMAIAHVEIANEPADTPSRLFGGASSRITGNSRARPSSRIYAIRTAEDLSPHRFDRFLIGFAIALLGSSHHFYFYKDTARSSRSSCPPCWMIVGFQVVLIGLVGGRDLGKRKLLEDVRIARRMGDRAHQPHGHGGDEGHLVADPRTVSVGSPR